MIDIYLQSRLGSLLLGAAALARLPLGVVFTGPKATLRHEKGIVERAISARKSKALGLGYLTAATIGVAAGVVLCRHLMRRVGVSW
jgi:hypothetical protein